jgi:putative colanic acid biosynthesis acetyltransferase WcaF
LKLATFDNSDFDRGRSALTEGAWMVIAGIFFQSWIPGSGWRVALLRLFGATVGQGVVIKPHARIKFPWRLSIGNNSWIGENVWIDNLAAVTIGDDCCLSQGAFLCTGNHRWDRDSFDLVTAPIAIENQCWIGAHACVSLGVTCHEGAVLTMGSHAADDLQAWRIHSGSPAAPVKKREPGAGNSDA